MRRFGTLPFSSFLLRNPFRRLGEYQPHGNNFSRKESLGSDLGRIAREIDEVVEKRQEELRRFKESVKDW